MKAAKKQSERFIDAARKAGCSEDEAEFDRNLKRITKRAVTPKKQPHKPIK